MTTVTKLELAQRTAALTGASVQQTRITIQAFLTVMELALINGQRIELRNFGVLEPREIRARKTHNPRNGVEDITAAHKKVAWKMGRHLMRALHPTKPISNGPSKPSPQ